MLQLLEVDFTVSINTDFFFVVTDQNVCKPLVSSVIEHLYKLQLNLNHCVVKVEYN